LKLAAIQLQTIHGLSEHVAQMIQYCYQILNNIKSKSALVLKIERFEAFKEGEKNQKKKKGLKL
jgi:hypothetical protein